MEANGVDATQPSSELDPTIFEIVSVRLSDSLAIKVVGVENFAISILAFREPCVTFTLHPS